MFSFMHQKLILFTKSKLRDTEHKVGRLVTQSDRITEDDNGVGNCQITQNDTIKPQIRYYTYYIN